MSLDTIQRAACASQMPCLAGLPPSAAASSYRQEIGQAMQRISTSRSGATLLEMIVVILIAGILAATIATRASSNRDRSAINQADQLRRDIAHLQVLALSWGVGLRLAIAS